jgi:hypothetical protein
MGVLCTELERKSEVFLKISKSANPHGITSAKTSMDTSLAV